MPGGQGSELSLTIPTNEVWMAASAMEYGFVVVTTDAHYEKVPQVIVERFPTE